MNYLQVNFLMTVLFASLGAAVTADEVDFVRDIAPIFEDRCIYCHGEDEQESGLRLDRRVNMLRGGDSGLAAIVPGKPEKSYLIDVINHVDEDMAMPPDDEKLTNEEIYLIQILYINRLGKIGLKLYILSNDYILTHLLSIQV